MKTGKLEISKEQAIALYTDASADFKKMLEDTFGKDVFLPAEERIDSFDDALKASGRPEVPEFDCVSEDLRPFFQATYKCVVIAEAFNQKKRFDIYDQKQERHYPYFANNGSASAFGLIVTYCAVAHSFAGSGSRLQNFDSETAEYSANQFKGVWKGVQLG